METAWRHRPGYRSRTLGTAVPAGLVLVTAAGCLATGWLVSAPLAQWPGFLLSLVAGTALHWRHRHPLPVLAVTTLCTVAMGAVGFLLTPIIMGPLLVAQYSVTLRRHRRTAWLSASITAASMIVAGLGIGLGAGLRHSLIIAFINPAGWVLLTAAFGSYVRVRREYAAARAEHMEREREELARHRVVQERMRIARELHDVVAHHLALANAQAGTAAHLARSNPDRAVEMLENLSGTTAEALREMKRTVGLLRQDTDTSEELGPAPGLDQLPDLVTTCSEAGLDVRVEVRGEPRALHPGLDLTAYRIVQEALTNVAKHAATSRARVRLAYTAHDLTVAVTNDADPRAGAAPRRAERGFGLAGMRERVLAAGGSFRAGPRARGGFEVLCSLPLNDDERSAA
ncbi:sensor histidine kinase [Streptomyces sp. NPDC003470]|uniref:sensor histidine kinase n=1 Tax=Streptomyces sp. NPDC127100 TaxID=3347138 RepID=UPI00366A2D9C